jgi:hypothetical protein
MRDAGATVTSDVSNIDAAPAVGLREYLLGARPLVGTIAASGLMLLACSWFALGTAPFGGSHDVGGPAAVRMDESAGAGAARDADAHATNRRDRSAIRRSHRVVPAATPDVRRPSEHASHGSTGMGRAPISETATPASGSAEPKTSGVAAAPAQAPVVSVETTLPPPLDQVEVPPLPDPPTLPIAPPALPSAPAINVTVGVP